jgi:hypothetical protein
MESDNKYGKEKSGDLYVDMKTYERFMRAYHLTHRERNEIAEAGILVEEGDDPFLMPTLEESLKEFSGMLNDPDISPKKRARWRKNVEERYENSCRVGRILRRGGEWVYVLEHPATIMMADILHYVASRNGSYVIAEPGSALSGEILNAAGKSRIWETFLPPGADTGIKLFRAKDMKYVQKAVPVARLCSPREEAWYLYEYFHASKQHLSPSPIFENVVQTGPRISEEFLALAVLQRPNSKRALSESLQYYHKNVHRFIFPSSRDSIDK